MPGSIQTYFTNYMNSRKGFKTFHNEVINMPRDNFSSVGLVKLQTFASYLLLTKRHLSFAGNTYKDIIEFIAQELPSHLGTLPYRNQGLENRYFTFTDLDSHYASQGRMFRHIMGMCEFWGIIHSISKQKKIIDFERCHDFVSLTQDKILAFTGSISLDINIKNNDFIANLIGIKPVKVNANYHPTFAILKYLNEINRPATDFEISILLGRIDSLQDEELILQRAFDIGRSFVATNRDGQVQEFFAAMNWKDESGALFSYTRSQEPWFKFQSYLLLLKSFGFIARNAATKNYTLTDDAKSLLGDLPASVINLNKLIAKLDLESGSMSDVTMKDALIRANMDTLKALISQNEFVRKINLYAINHEIRDRNGGKQRNQFIAELARIREDYKCQAGTITFERPDGRNYVEAHHIIEFAKGGPDVLENLLALGPTPHTQIHRGSDRAIKDIYTDLMSRGAISYALFKTMASDYHCLTSDNVDVLVSKSLISQSQKAELLSIIAIY
jgi:hypothetical protein